MGDDPSSAGAGAFPRAVVVPWLAGEPLPQLPAGPGVAQVLGPDDRPLLTGRPASLRRWVASQLGPPRPLPVGRRPPTDLRPLARAVRVLPTAGSFEQRLVHERWLAPLVPLSKRHDLRPPAFLRLDPGERFPRVTICGEVAGAGLFFGPFRDRGAAEKALKPLHRQFPLRPCDLEFEPRPGLALGESCFFAQVRTCAAPCLERIPAEDYRALAQAAARFLADGGRSDPASGAWLPRDCGEVRGRALVVEPLKTGRLRVFPVRDGCVLDGQALALDAGGEPGGPLEALDWQAPAVADDRVWLANWLLDPKRRARFLPVPAGESAAALAARVRVVS